MVIFSYITPDTPPHGGQMLCPSLLRTLVHSLDALGGTMKWGYGVEIGTYAQHVYSSLDERLTVLEQLEYSSDSNTTRQDLLAMAGALLFRDEHIQKKIKVLS